MQGYIVSYLQGVSKKLLTFLLLIVIFWTSPIIWIWPWSLFLTSAKKNRFLSLFPWIDLLAMFAYYFSFVLSADPTYPSSSFFNIHPPIITNVVLAVFMTIFNDLKKYWLFFYCFLSNKALLKFSSRCNIQLWNIASKNFFLLTFEFYL